MNDYRDVYASDCGKDFPSRIQGIEHERDCDRCEEIRRRREVDRDDEDAAEGAQ